MRWSCRKVGEQVIELPKCCGISVHLFEDVIAKFFQRMIKPCTGGFRRVFWFFNLHPRGYSTPKCNNGAQSKTGRRLSAGDHGRNIFSPHRMFKQCRIPCHKRGLNQIATGFEGTLGIFSTLNYFYPISIVRSVHPLFASYAQGTQ